MCSVGAAPGAASLAGPQNDENDQHYEESQAMDTSDADIGANSARKRRQGQLDLTAAKKKAAEQPTGSRLDASGDCSTTIGGGSSTATGIGQCVTAANSDCDPPNSCAGWTVVVSRREKKRQEAENPSQRDTQTAGKPSKSLSASNAKLKEERRREQKEQYVAKVNANMAKSARMPTFAKKDEHRVVVRPRGGLVVSATKMSVLRAAIITAANIKIEEAEDDSFAPNAAQNIIVLSTPSEARSFRYGSIRSITVEERTYETFAYKSTPDNTSRGVISGVGREEPEEQITRFLVNKHNPTVMAAHRLGNTESVVILFEGNKVPHYVKYGGFVTKCTLYRQHREVCTTCGQIGHRKDVCPTPNAKVCFACGRNNPREDHAKYCKPRCKLCGGSHITGAGSCKNKFKTPLQIKQRQWAKQNTEAITKMAPPPPGPPPPQMAPAPAKEPGKTNKSDVNRAAMTQKSGAPSGAAAATPKEPGKMPSGSSCSEQCKKETRELKGTVQKMEKAMEELQTAMAAMQLTIKQQRGVIDQQRDAIRSLQEGEARDEANDNKMTTDADEKDNGTLANIAGNAFANTITPETFQFTAKATIPTRASIVASARGLEEQPEEEIESASESDEEEDDSASVTSVAAINNGDKTKPLGYGSLSKKIGQNARAIQKWGKSFEGLEQRILTKCTQVIQQQLAQTIQLQIEQALERALSPEKLQPLLDSNNKIKIWHWNANGFRCRKAILQQYLRSLEPTARPDVIAVQETHTEDTPTLPGYRARARPPSARTCGKGAAQGVCTFIRKGIAHVEHQQFLGSRDTTIELCVTELAISGKGRGARGERKKKTSTTVFIANIYSNPRHGKQKFKTLFHKIKSATSQAQKPWPRKEMLPR
ncbi:hypothetical protein HPB49_021883 [Dermacentor silvarum]|uniref:Uncharacterized protein n=1 Tax=Dermacentor silvarum TaxID=543639 RepID=A0ACB8CMP0_DERSI|nr:hypothetical protein HPB49_021883 [Dermacentor silvarum]